jgi:folate-binding protein YgfZ
MAGSTPTSTASSSLERSFDSGVYGRAVRVADDGGSRSTGGHARDERMTDAVTCGLATADRATIRIGGAEARDFLQGLVSNDVRGLHAGAVYAALLTPQGKYLFDFFLVEDGEDVILDVKADRAAALAQRLAMYKLRAKVTVAPAGLEVARGLGPRPAGHLVVADPRGEELGWRAYVADAAAFVAGMAPLDKARLEALRVELGVPETGIELVADDSYILEMDFERLNGVDFRKGCYVGQEVTARMKHKTELRKGLARVEVEGQAPPPGTEIEAGGKPAGALYTTAGGRGLAYLRFDRATGEMRAGEATVRLPAAAS